MRAFELAGKQRGAALTWVIVAVLAIALAVWAFTMRGGPSVSTKISPLVLRGSSRQASYAHGG